MINLAIVGCGRIARAHLQAVKAAGDVCRLIEAVDLSREAAERVAADFPGVRIFTSLDHAAEESRAEAVILCLPHAMLAPAARLFIEHGKHVLVEKPCGTVSTAGDYFQAQRHASAHGLVLLPGYVRRFMDRDQMIHRLVCDGAIGTIRQSVFSSISCLHTRATPWWQSAAMAGGFWLPLFGTHVLDQLLWYMQGAPTSVVARYFSGHPLVEGESHGMVLLDFGDGLAHAVTFAMLSYPDTPAPSAGKSPGSGVLLLGDRGTLEVGEALLLNGAQVEVPASAGQPMEGQLRHFIARVEGEHGDAVVTPEDGACILRILLAADRSNQQQLPVALEDVGL